MGQESDQIALRIQKRLLAETRQQLAEAESKLEIVQGQVDRLAKVLTTRELEVEETIKKAQAALAMAETKDRTIEMLKQRVSNVNAEYNQQFGGNARSMAQADKEAMRSPREFTTLEDVYKLTGESYSKDDHRS